MSPDAPDEDLEARGRAEARRKGLAFADVRSIPLDAAALAAIPVVLQTEYEVFPVRLDVGTLYVAMGEAEPETCAALASFTGCRIVPVLGVPERFAGARRRPIDGA